MNFGITIMGLIAIGICIIPSVIVFIKRKNKEKHLIQKLRELALQSNKILKTSEIWNNNAIGLDESESYIFAIRNTKEGTNHYAININEVAKCQMLKNSRNLKHYNEDIVDRIALAFVNKNKGVEDVIIEFYNTDFDNFFLSGELQKMEKWNTLVNKIITKS